MLRIAPEDGENNCPLQAVTFILDRVSETIIYVQLWRAKKDFQCWRLKFNL